MSAESGPPERRPPSPNGGSVDRGQTVLDFAVGTSVFLLAVAFTFAFVPSLLEPFSAGEGARLVVAERSAARLVETSLSASSAPSVLSTACTADFFDGAEPDDDCNWNANADDLETELGVASHLGVQVTVRQGGEVVEELGEREVTMRGGEEPPPRASVSTGSRVVTFDDDDVDGTYRLTVWVW